MIFGGAREFYVYRISDHGEELQKAMSAPLILIAVSPDGQWVAVQDPAAWGALIVYPAGGGSPVRLCDQCAPPWGTDPMPFYFGWAPDSRVVYWNFDNATYAIPLPAGRMLPRNPRRGNPIEGRRRRAAGSTIDLRTRPHGPRPDSVDVRLRQGVDAAEHLPRSGSVVQPQRPERAGERFVSGS